MRHRLLPTCDRLKDAPGRHFAHVNKVIVFVDRKLKARKHRDVVMALPDADDVASCKQPSIRTKRDPAGGVLGFRHRWKQGPVIC